jgi:polysaccharide deacetylase 2 family uncharacterized protein YibQ
VAREAAPTKPVARPDAPHQAAAMPVLTGKSPGSPILPPQMALLEPLSPQSPSRLPRIGPDGMTPMAAYAGGFAPNDPRPKVGIILSGIGLSDSDSEDAIRLLPAGVTLAVSPYALHPETLLDQARAAGHELLLSIPMEPQGYPLNDEGPQELLTGAALGVNAQRLLWALSRITGYAGTTGALDGMRGERFGSITDQLGQMQDQLAARGLFYIDPRPGQPPPARVRGRGIDLVIDEPAVGFEIEAKLATLVKLAIDRGSALGLAGLPRPVTVNRLAAWATQIAAQGVVLVPASALVHDLPLPRVEAKP